MKVYVFKFVFSGMILLFCFQQNTMAQNASPASTMAVTPDAKPYSSFSITPPSPVAYAMGKFGRTPVGLYSGTNNANIALCEYKTRNLSVPLSLNYSSNGIKVDELGSNVGLSWSFSGGGVISRIIRGMPDEKGGEFFPASEVHKPGAMTDPKVMAYFKNLGATPTIDSEVDLYMFNFNGYSGQFAFNENHQIIQVPKQALDIESIPSALGANAPAGFRITAPDGVEYNFSDLEYTVKRIEGSAGSPSGKYVTAWYLSSIIHPLGDVINFVYGETGSYTYVASQQQSLTRTPGNQIVCDFEEEPTLTNYTSINPVLDYNITTTFKTLTEINSNYPESGKIVIHVNYSHPEVPAYKLISSISVFDKNNSELEHFDLNYLSTANKRVFLQKVTAKDVTKVYELDYIEPFDLPSRLSFSQDHWGYYNGIHNSYLFPDVNYLEGGGISELAALHKGGIKSPDPSYAVKGLLKRITFPTGGYNEYAYESNKFRKKEVILPPETNLTLYAQTDSKHTTSIDTQKASNVKFSQDVKLDLDIMFKNDEGSSGCVDSNRIAGKFTISDLTNPSSNPPIRCYRLYSDLKGNVLQLRPDADLTGYYVTLQPGHDYEFKLETTSKCAAVSLLASYSAGASSEVVIDKATGGMRLQKIAVNDGINPASEITRYYYGAAETPEVSSGSTEVIPQYVSRRIKRVLCQNGTHGEYRDIRSFEVLSSSMNSLYDNIGSQTTRYSNVTLSHGGDNFENGGESHEFILGIDMPGGIIYGNHISAAPWSNLGTFNGKEKSVSYFKKSESAITIIKKDVNEYVQDTRYYEEISSFVVEQVCAEQPMGRNVSYECTAECVNQGPIVIHYCSTQHHDKDTDKPRDHVYKMKWNKWYDPFSKRKIICISNDPPAPNNITYDYYGPCHGKPVGTVLFNSNAVENLNIMEYKTISTWEYLKSSKAITYDENGQNPSTVATYYEYGNPIHMQATAISTTFENASTGTQRATYTKRSFLPDYNFPDNLTGTAAVLNNMGDQHIWNVPIEELNYTLIGSSSRLISGSLNTFKMNGKCVVKDKEYSIKNNNSTVYQDLVVATPATINSAGTFVFDPHYEQANSFDVYDANNNLIQLTDRKNKSAFIREPNTGNVWAQVTNSSYDDIAYSSFEHKAYSFTNWYYKSTGITTASAQSGQNALDLGKSFIASTKTLSASQKYKLSFWKNVNTGAFSVLAGSQNLTPRSGPIRNGWQYFECIFTSATRVQITGTATIDEVRLCPESARMTTYLFKDGVGVISQCNENNQNTFWEYDEFNRLKLVRDQDGFILNKNEYKYQQAQ